MKPKFIPIAVFAMLFNISFAQTGTVEKKFEELFQDVFAEDEPGGSVLLMKGGEVKYLGHFGLADVGTKEVVSDRTVFNTGSISKTFVANAILILHERKKLSIQDPISKYFDDFESDEIANSVSIAHLLSHTSGLPDIRNVRNNTEYFLTAKDEGNWNPIKKAQKLKFEPGSSFEYSNPAYNGLALIIEKVTGEKWQAFVKREIFDKVGMTLSTITDGSHPESGVAHAYDPSGAAFIESDYGEFPTFAAAGNGGVWSTVLELAMYERALQSGLIISTELLEESRMPFKSAAWKGNEESFVGYSWFLDGNSNFGSGLEDINITYHTGSQGGFRAFFITIPEKDIVYIGLFNRPFSQYRSVISGGVEIMRKAGWM